MKFQPDLQDGVNLISRQEAARIQVGPRPFEASVVVPWVGEPLPWDAPRFETLTAGHFERIAALNPEVVIFGSGARIRFPHPSLLRPLIERRIGVETMDTAAACRTYNVLASERRNVVAALLIEGPEA
jgi:uncharacterized protein